MLKKNIIRTVAIAFLTFVMVLTYNNFLSQERTDLTIDQVNGGDLEFGVALTASRDYSTVIVLIGVAIILLIWIPFLQKLTKEIKKDVS